MIPLILEYTRVNLRPYMYALKHRAIIEQFIQDMLDRGINQNNNNSLFAYRIILVGKKDSIQRLYVDYGSLNKKTMKVSIHLVEELIDQCKNLLKKGPQGFT